MKTIRGQIIRILDRRSVIINLGSNDGITNQSVFNILGDPEPIIDPFSKVELGMVMIVKARIKADRVDEKFSIATTKWTNKSATNKAFAGLADAISALYSPYEVEVDEGELNVDPKDIQPWKARSEQLVKVGDIVEVAVEEEIPEIEGAMEETEVPSVDGERNKESGEN